MSGGSTIPATTPPSAATGRPAHDGPVASTRDTSAAPPDAARRPAHNLPVETTSFVGRDRELGELTRLLRQTRLLTLGGAGGSGKTRLALRAAGNVARSSPGGTWWVDLAALSDAALVPERVAAAVGVAEAPGRPVTASLVGHLRARATLLVLDNCEHLVDACAALVDALLRACPDVRLLVTSREPLGVAGEVTWPVPPLALPDPRQAPAVDDLLRCPAVQLFVERARAVSPGFDLTADNAAAVAGLCARLDGMPLAIELAASRIRMLAPQQLLDRLDDRFRLLADRRRTTVPRHRTLRATMDWSHDLLSAQERALFRRLSVFAGGFALGDAERVCAGHGIATGAVLDVLSDLVDKSLVVAAPDQAGDVRYRTLETVRQYAAERLAAAGEADTVRAGHADAVLALADEAERGLMGPAQQAWLQRLEREHANLAGALSWLLQRGDARRGLRLAGALGRFWWFAGHFAEGAGWLEAFLALAGARARTPERAGALHALGLATFWHETVAAGVEASRTRFEEAAAIYRELGDTARLSAVLRDLGGYWKGAGDAAAARAVLDESRALARACGDAFGVGAATGYLGVVAAYEGDVAAARSLLEDALADLRACGGPDEVTRCLFFLTCVACDAGDLPAAHAWFDRLMRMDPVHALPYSVGFGLDGMARLAAAEGDAVRALRLVGAAHATHERIGTSAGPAYDRYMRHRLEPAWHAVPQEVAATAYQDGRALPLERALALGLRSATRRPRAAASGAGVLTAREVEVLAQVADGLSDAQAAARLCISPRTVSNHLGSVYRKLGVGSRTAAIKHARDLGLL